MKHASLFRRAAALLFAALLFLAPITASAAEVGAIVPLEGSASAPLESTATQEVSEEGVPVGAAIADFFREYAGELLAGATFLLTLCVSLFIKQRIVPSLLSSLTNLLGKGRTALDAITEKQTAETEKIDALLYEIGGLLADARAAAERAEEAAALVREKNGSGEALLGVLSCEAELLFSLLLSANLPQYEKDRVAAVYARIADHLGASHE